MDINRILLVAAALLPALVLCVYVFLKDRTEKEPAGLLIGLLFMGVLICYPACKTEEALFALLEKLFASHLVSVDGFVLCTGPYKYLYYALENFIAVALVEEGLKWIAMLLLTRKNKNFNSLFDGLIYAVFVSLGFAAFENILYVLNYGWSTAFIRALTAVPGHMFDGVIMGYFYSMWHMLEKAGAAEKHLKQIGAIAPGTKNFSGKNSLILSLAVPVLCHGLYDYCCTMSGTVSLIVFYGFLLGLYVYCFGLIRRMSKNDSLDSKYAALLILKKYPYITQTMSTAIDKSRVRPEPNPDYRYR